MQAEWVVGARAREGMYVHADHLIDITRDATRLIHVQAHDMTDIIRDVTRLIHVQAHHKTDIK